jgi:hypothetical protein
VKIGAVTVPEIAVSIAAELIQIRRAEALKAVEGPFESKTSFSAAGGCSIYRQPPPDPENPPA